MTAIDFVKGRRPTWGDALVLIMLALYSCFALLPALPVWVPVLLFGGVALFSASFLRAPRFDRAAGAMVGALCLYLGLALKFHWFVWPAYLAVPIFAAIAVGFIRGFQGDYFAVARLGRFGLTEWALVLLTALVSAAGLLLWVRLLEPDLARFKAMVPHWSVAGLVGAGLVFVVVNATLEEFIWRGILLRWLRSFAPQVWAVLIQALCFGAWHYTGFPGGIVGAALATVYGAILGTLALRSRGLVAPIIAHIGADAVIFAIVASRL